MAHKPNFTAQLSRKANLYGLALRMGFTQSRGKGAGHGSIREMLEQISIGNAVVVHVADDLEYNTARLREIADREEREGSRMTADLLRRLALALESAEQLNLQADIDLSGDGATYADESISADSPAPEA